MKTPSIDHLTDLLNHVRALTDAAEIKGTKLTALADSATLFALDELISNDHQEKLRASLGSRPITLGTMCRAHAARKGGAAK